MMSRELYSPLALSVEPILQLRDADASCCVRRRDADERLLMNVRVFSMYRVVNIVTPLDSGSCMYVRTETSAYATPTPHRWTANALDHR
jgi:hypothetical protein